MSFFLSKVKHFFSSRSFWIMLFICTLGFILRLYRLGDKVLEYDEVFTYREIFTDYFNPTHPRFPIYFYKFFLMFFDNSIYSLKIMSPIWTFLTMIFIYYLGKIADDRKTGIIAAIIICILPTSLKYSQLVRPYAQYMAVTTLLYISYLLSMKKRDIKHYFLFGLMIVVCFFTHQLTFFMIFSFVIAIIFQAFIRPKKEGKKMLSLYLPIILISSILGTSWLFLLDFIGPREFETIGYDSLPPVVEYLERVLVYIGPGTNNIFSKLTIFLSGLIGVIALLGLKRINDSNKNLSILLSCNLLIPIILTYFSLGVKWWWEWERYLTYMTIPYVICIASGIRWIDQLYRYQIKLVGTSLVILFLIPGISNWYQLHHKKYSHYLDYAKQIHQIPNLKGVIFRDFNIAYTMKLYRTDQLKTFFFTKYPDPLKKTELISDGYTLKIIPLRTDQKLETGEYFYIDEVNFKAEVKVIKNNDDFFKL